MNDRPIGKGDLAMVIRTQPCCGWESPLGFTFTVQAIRFDPNAICGHCKKSYQATIAFDGAILKGGFDVKRLKRIDPGNISEDVPTKEELTA
ncbi:MAG: hypothetical protein NUV75_12975 [Gallionella sp.]|nr:hypothetical protein [Gallionella sp.]